VIFVPCGAQYLRGFLCSLRDCQTKTDVSSLALRKENAKGAVGEAWEVVQRLHNTVSSQKEIEVKVVRFK